MLDLCTLGTGGALPLPERGLSSLYVRLNGRGVLVDCGEATQTAIRILGWGFRSIDALLITHDHSDHIACRNVLIAGYGELIAADIHTTAVNGFMHGLKKNEKQ